MVRGPILFKRYWGKRVFDFRRNIYALFTQKLRRGRNPVRAVVVAGDSEKRQPVCFAELQHARFEQADCLGRRNAPVKNITGKHKAVRPFLLDYGVQRFFQKSLLVFEHGNAVNQFAQMPVRGMQYPHKAPSFYMQIIQRVNFSRL